MYVVLTDAEQRRLVPDACIARTPILQQAFAANANASVRLPCDSAAWTDWCTNNYFPSQPLAVARVRANRSSRVRCWYGGGRARHVLDVSCTPHGERPCAQSMVHLQVLRCARAVRPLAG